MTDRVDLLAARGPDLGRPVVDRIHSTRHQLMKEPRAAKGGDRPVPDPGVGQLEDPPHHRRRVGVGFEHPEADPGCGLLTLRVGLAGDDVPGGLWRTPFQRRASKAMYYSHRDPINAHLTYT